MAKNNYYAVVQGNKTGIFDSWSECEKNVKGFKGALYKGFPTKPLAEQWYKGQIGEGPEVEEKKIYAVIKGRTPSIYYSWSKAKEQVDGFKGAVYKSFPNTEEGHVQAAEYFANHLISNGEGDTMCLPENEEYEVMDEKAEELSKAPNTVSIYTDGSWGKCNDGHKCYAGGITIIDNAQISKRLCVSGDKSGFSDQQNVAGELQACVRAINYITKNRHDIKKVHLFADYEGIICWPDNLWEARTEYSKQYADYINSMRSKLAIEFHHVKGHNKDKYNEECDHLASYSKQCFIEKREPDMDEFLSKYSYINIELPKKNIKHKNNLLYESLQEKMNDADLFEKFKEKNKFRHKTFEAIYKSCLKETKDKFLIDGEDLKSIVLTRLENMIEETAGATEQ